MRPTTAAQIASSSSVSLLILFFLSASTECSAVRSSRSVHWNEIQKHMNSFSCYGRLQTTNRSLYWTELLWLKRIIYEKKRKTQNNTLNRLLNFFCLLHPSWNKQMMFSCVRALPFSCLAKDPMGWVLRRSLKSRTTHYFLLWFRFSFLCRIFCILCNLFGVLYALKRSRFCWFETIAVCIMKRVEEKTITAQTHTHTHNWNEMQEQ